jgi:RNA polymerase sigma factor (sigma-70 family)
MARVAAHSLHRLLRQLAAAHRADTGSDAELLRLFVQRHEESAFTALVQRYGGLVWNVCRRRLGHDADAEDAFQATFLVLLQRAGSVRRGESVGSWPYGVASRVAGKARQRRDRRRARESFLAHDPAVRPAPDPPGHDLRPVLDEEVRRLPEPYRAAFVLCCLDGLTQDEAAGRLGCAPGTVASRLARARQRLRARLLRRGVGSAGAVLAGVGAAPAPAGCRAVARAVGGGVASPAAVALAEEVVRSMTLAKLKMPALVVLVAGLIGAGLGLRSPAAPVAAPVAAAGGALAPVPEPKPRPGPPAAELAKQAAELTAPLPDDLRKSRLLSRLAVARARLGDRDGALQSFAQAAGVVERMPGGAGNSQELEWRELAKAQAEAGLVADALKSAEKVLTPGQAGLHAATLQEVAGRLARSRRFADALRVAAKVPGEQRQTALWDVALGQAAAGDFAAALQTADQISEPSVRIRVLVGPEYPFFASSVALAQARAGDRPAALKTLGRAIELAKAIDAEPARSVAWSSVAQTQARLGELDDARRSVERVTAGGFPHADRAAAETAIAVAEAERNRWDVARRTVEALKAPAERARALVRLADVRAKAGDKPAARDLYREALKEVDSIRSGEDPATERWGLRHLIAMEQAAHGFTDDAKATVVTNRQAEGERSEALTVSSVASYQAQAGDFAGALKTAEEIGEDPGRGIPWWRAETVRDVAGQQTRAGKEADALKWVAAEEQPYLKAAGLVGVLEGRVK